MIKLQSIPDYAFNSPELVYIWLGEPFTYSTLPIIQLLAHIGKYSFYNLPNLYTIHIYSPFLTKIGK